MSTLSTTFFQKFNQIRPLETNFTEVLESIALKPKTLYFYGKMPENVVKPYSKKETNKNITLTPKATRPKTVAIVGSRHNTRYGEEIAYKMAYELAKNGVIIVSGLAFGIDSVAHQAALDANGITVAVLGTPIDKIYPRNHERLAKEIVEKGGAILSEYAPGEQVYPNTNSFLMRNRLISGLSDIVVVVEAAERSGSLNTAAHALNQGKDVFAVPGNITNTYSKGCNMLIKQGAIPYTEPDDILRSLFPERFYKKRKKVATPLPFGDTELETKVLQAISEGSKSGEEIIKKTNLSPELVNETITILEIKSRIRALGMNNWSLL